MTEFKIGDSAWLARFMYVERWSTCPDCMGSGKLDVILADGTKHSIDCAGCERGYLGPTGKIPDPAYSAFVLPVIINGIEQHAGRPTEYSTADCYLSAEIFATREEAEERAKVLAAEHEAEERERLAMKEKPARSWAWHVHYHRAEIRRAEKAIAHHTARLNVARLKAKEPKE